MDMVTSHNVTIAIAMVLALATGFFFGRSSIETVNSALIDKNIRSERAFAIEAGVGGYVVDPKTGSTEFKYENQKK